MNRKRRTLRHKHRVLRNLRERDLDRLLQLRISPGDHVSRCDLDVEIGSHANVFYAPVRATGIVRGTIRKTDLTAIDQRRREVIRTNAATESTLTNNWTNFRKLEHEGARFRGRPVQFIYDHDFH